MYLVRILCAGLVNKALIKFESLWLRNEIDVTNVWIYFYLVSCKKWLVIFRCLR